MSQSVPLVSVVTPMYNESEFVSECIESILAQTYQNWEFLIVDNCSTDGSGEIASRYAAVDSRIKVLRNKRFLGAVANYNHALSQVSAQSKYCKVVFADDWIFPECLEKMVATAEAQPRVGIVTAYCLAGGKVICTGVPYFRKVVSGPEVCRRLFLEGVDVLGSPTSVLYRADIVKQHAPFYDEANIHCDTEAGIVILKKWNLGFVHQVLTYSRVRASRITRSQHMNTFLGGKLHHLVKHGHDLLTAEEFDCCLRRLLADYYWYLGRSVFGARGELFWQYHKQAFRDAGFEFKRTRLARAALGNICVGVLNLQSTIERVLLRTGMASMKSVDIEPVRTP